MSTSSKRWRSWKKTSSKILKTSTAALEANAVALQSRKPPQPPTLEKNQKWNPPILLARLKTFKRSQPRPFSRNFCRLRNRQKILTQFNWKGKKKSTQTNWGKRQESGWWSLKRSRSFIIWWMSWEKKFRSTSLPNWSRNISGWLVWSDWFLIWVNAFWGV